MKVSVLSIAFILIGMVSAFGQNNIEKVYSVDKKRKPFFLRWYWNARQINTTIYKESLVLEADGRFERQVATTCAKKTYVGKWEQDGSRIILHIEGTTPGKTTLRTIEYKTEKNKLTITTPDYSKKPPHLTLRK